MPDISMCINEYCKLKKDCYRYTAKPAEFWQTYNDFHYTEHPDKTVTCNYFIDNSEYKLKREGIIK